MQRLNNVEMSSYTQLDLKSASIEIYAIATIESEWMCTTERYPE